jgi:hypothetical protein
MFQPLDIPHIILLPVYPLYLPELQVSSFEGIPDWLSLVTTTNFLLQTPISELRTLGIWAAWLNACEWFRRSQRSIYRWLNNFAASNPAHKRYDFHRCKARREDEIYAPIPSLNPLNGRYVVPSWKLIFHICQGDILEELEEGQQGCFQDEKALS